MMTPAARRAFVAIVAAAFALLVGIGILVAVTDDPPPCCTTAVCR